MNKTTTTSVIVKPRFRVGIFGQKISIPQEGIYGIKCKDCFDRDADNWHTIILPAELRIEVVCRALDEYHATGLIRNWLNKNGLSPSGFKRMMRFHDARPNGDCSDWHEVLSETKEVL